MHTQKQQHTSALKEKLESLLHVTFLISAGSNGLLLNNLKSLRFRLRKDINRMRKK